MYYVIFYTLELRAPALAAGLAGARCPSAGAARGPPPPGCLLPLPSPSTSLSPNSSAFLSLFIVSISNAERRKKAEKYDLFLFKLVFKTSHGIALA